MSKTKVTVNGATFYINRLGYAETLEGKKVKWKKSPKTDRRRCGYFYASIDRKTVYMHRALAIAFIENPKDKPCVNHKDGNGSNNCLSNLEWCTYSENNQHAYDAGLKNHEKPVIVTFIPTNSNYYFKSIKQALEYTKQQHSTAQRFLKGIYKTPKTYNYKYQ